MTDIKTKKEKLDEILSQIEEKVFEEKDSLLLRTSFLVKMPIMKSFEYISKFIKSDQYTIDSMKNEIKKVIDLDKYYKSPDGKKSIKIVFDGNIKNAISTSNNSIIKNRILSSDCTIKSFYLNDKHTNFFELDVESDQSTIKSIKREDAEETILLSIISSKRFSCEFSICKTDIYYSTPLQRNLDIFYASVFNYKFGNYSESNRPNKLCSIARIRMYPSHKMTRSGLGEEETIKELIRSCSFVSSTKSKAISSILDIYDVQKSKLDSISKIEKVNSVNPVSGFVSVKAIRVPKDENTSKEEVDKLAKNFFDTNLFFESFSNEIQKILILKQARNKKEVKEIFGDDIKRLYHVSSYFSYKVASTGIVIRDEKCDSGTLGNSCMKNADSISRIDFYSKNPHFISMLAITDASTKKIHARAIVWTDPETKVKYVDRIYYHNTRDYNLMVAHICSTNNMHSIYYSQSASFPENKTLVYFSVNVDRVNGIYRLPYMDSVRIVKYKDKISIGIFERNVDSIHTNNNIDLTKESISVCENYTVCHYCRNPHSSLLRHPSKEEKLYCPSCVSIDIFKNPFLVNYDKGRECNLEYFNNNINSSVYNSSLRFCTGIISKDNKKGRIIVGCGIYDKENVGVPVIDKYESKENSNLSLLKVYLKIKHGLEIPDQMTLGMPVRMSLKDVLSIAYDKRYFKTINIENYSIIVEKDDSEICKKSIQNVELLIKAIGLNRNDFCNVIKENIDLIHLLNRNTNSYILANNNNVFADNLRIYEDITPSYIVGKDNFNAIFIRTSSLFNLERSIFIPLNIFDCNPPKSMDSSLNKTNKIASKVINKFGKKK